mmetsp:Transcript_35275/g.92570  ORF Transcript_35275/g.92570 Transcript_35275/m.92570 type:complete len:185 (-) Transcript_35275:43-597(-)
MQKLERFRKRVEKAKRDEFDAAAATRAAEEELISEEVASGLKRRRIEPDETDANYKAWARSDWLRQETWTQNRRKEPLRAGVTVLPPRDGEHGYLHHWRRGGVGWVQDWARGDISIAAMMLATLIKFLNLTEKVRAALPKTKTESLARQGARTRGAGLRQLQGMGPTTFVLHVDTDSDLRSRCE